MLKTNFFYLLFVTLSVLTCRPQSLGNLESDGPQLYFQPTPKMFPSSWYDKEIKAQTAALPDQEVKRSTQCLQEALKKYPKKIITENLTGVYVLGKLNFYGLNYGGTYYKSTVFIGNKGVENGYTDEWLQQTFHHEFSSILLKNYRNYFNESEWLKCNSSDFTYGSGGKNAIAEGKSSSEFDSNFNQIGLLNQYSAAELEEDFNEFSENLFYPHEGFNHVLEKYAAIRKKREILIDFYQHIDPSFTKLFFDNILSGTADEPLNGK